MAGDKRFETVEVLEIYRGSLLSLATEKVRIPSGRLIKREVVRGVRAAAAAAVKPSGSFVLVRQYRQPVGDEILEIPAGLVDPEENPERTAARELLEETGYRAGRLVHLADFYTTPGYSDELMSLYLATELSKEKAAPEADEEIEVVEVAYDEALRMISEGKIRDAKTIVGILLAEIELRRAR